ncbi:MAG TPA: hypothetical protein VE888_01480 [Streptosporangiaceae bacterium]|nr:hypothetical protein [Streptosporangiaceae bacterium]
MTAAEGGAVVPEHAVDSHDPSQLSGRLRSGASQASQQAAAKAGLLRSQLAGRMSGPLKNAQSAAGTARDQVRKITPDQLPDAARKTAAAAWRRRAPLVDRQTHGEDCFALS